MNLLIQKKHFWYLLFRDFSMYSSFYNSLTQNILELNNVSVLVRGQK